MRKGKKQIYTQSLGRSFAHNWKKNLLSVILIVLAIAWLMPLVFGFFATFKSTQDVRQFVKYKNILPRRGWITQNYVDAWNYGAAPFLSMATNSLYVSGMNVLLALFGASTSAYAYERLTFRGKEVLFWTLMGLSMIPGVVSIVTSFYLHKMLGTLNTLTCLFIGAGGGIFNVYLLRNFMVSVPKEMDESARIDGANDFQIYAYIVLPCLFPALMVLALFSFTGSWNDLLWPTLAISSPKKITLTPGIRQIASTMGDNHYERVLASCWLAMIPTLLVYLVARKYFLSGLQLGGAIKG